MTSQDSVSRLYPCVLLSDATIKDGAPFRYSVDAGVAFTFECSRGVLQLCGFAVIVVEHTTQSLAALDVILKTSDGFVGVDQLVVQPLMVTFSMIMKDEFGHGTPQRMLSEEDHPIQTLALDRQNKPLGVMRSNSGNVRQANDFCSGVLDQIAKVRGEFSYPDP